MVGKITSALRVFKAGKMVSNPEAWKKGQVAASSVSAFVFACIAAFSAWTGTEIDVDSLAVDSISVSVVALVPVVIGVFNAVATVISTTKIGLQDEREHSGG